MNLVDSHCHLDFPDFDAELDAVIARAEAVGVQRMVSICTKPRLFDQVRDIAETYEAVYFAAGLHPLYAHEEEDATLSDFDEWAKHPKFVGIGEAGIDFHYRRDTEARQRESLALQIEAARRTGLPLIIHARDADAELIEILTAEHAAGSYGCVMHCFSSGPALAEAALDLGFYLSMSGVATFKNAKAVREIFRTAPRERVLVETDAPYLAPPPHRGKRNEPAYVAHTVEIGAALYDLTPEAFAELTTDNFHRLFSKTPRANPGPKANPGPEALR